MINVCDLISACTPILLQNQRANIAAYCNVSILDMRSVGRFNSVRKVRHNVGELSNVDTLSPKSFLTASKCSSKVIDYGNNQSGSP